MTTRHVEITEAIDHERAALERMKLEAELGQLRFENRWLREANKGLSEALEKARKVLPPEALV
jgi:hypothetical protein